MNTPRNVFVAFTVARSRTNFYFSQRSRQEKTLRGMFISGHVVATKLQDNLQEKLPSVTAPLVVCNPNGKRIQTREDMGGCYGAVPSPQGW